MSDVAAVRLYEGDALDVLKTIPDNTYTGVVTDPPYGLSSQKDPIDVLKQWIEWGDYVKRRRGGGLAAEKGFLGSEWDAFVPGPRLWGEVYRVCRPGAIALVFSATRTMDWMGMSLRLAGFECLDVIGYMNSSGMPKAGTLDKKIDRYNGDIRPVVGPERCEPRRAVHTVLNQEHARFHGDRTPTAPASDVSAKWAGWSTTLAPAYEPIIVVRKPCEGTAVANVLKWGCGAMNIDACRIRTGDKLVRPAVQRFNNAVFGHGLGSGTQVEPGGRWPKNAIIDDATAAVLDATVGERKSGSRRAGATSVTGWLGQVAPGREYPEIEGSTGGASRFFEVIDQGGSDDIDDGRFAWVGPKATAEDIKLPFMYCPKAAKKDRNAGLPEGQTNNHSTVKPHALMRWLCRLIGHPEGRLLDPFAGSGSTLRAARAEGLPCDGIERDHHYCVDLAAPRAGVDVADVIRVPPLDSAPETCEDASTSTAPNQVGEVDAATVAQR